MEELGYPIPWKPSRYAAVMARRREAKEKVFSHAYTIRPGRGYETTYEYQVAEVFGPMWEARTKFPHKVKTLHGVAEWLQQFEGMGEFMAAQVVADIKYTPRFGQTQMSDWETYVSPGPGSRRGLARVCGLPFDYRWPADDWYRAFFKLKEKIDPLVERAHMPPIHAQDLQNCLCEFDKLCRLRNGEGSVRARYAGEK
jgi:hypothetical protein